MRLRMPGTWLLLATGSVVACANERVVATAVEAAGSAQVLSGVTQVGPTSKLLYATRAYGPFLALETVSPDGTRLTRVTLDQNSYSAPAGSPDGRWIAYSSVVAGQGSIFVMRSDLTQVRQLPSTTSFDGSPAWSPDGRRLAFVGTHASPFGTVGRLYVMDLEGQAVKQITFDPTPGLFDSHSRPSWSHTGAEIAFRSMAGLERVRADGSARQVISTTAPFCDAPSWSPVAAIIACSGADLTGEWQLYTLRPDGSDRRILVRSADQLVSPDWSPDGSELAFTRIENGVRTLYRISRTGTKERPVHATPRDVLNPTWVR